MWPQKKTQETFGETKFIILTGPGTPCKATWGRLRVVRRQKASVRGELGLGLLLGVQRKSKTKMDKQFSTGYLV